MTAALPADEPIPDSHRDLLERPICGVLTTLLPDGQPHSCLVWVDHDGTCARANTTLQRLSGRDLAADPRVSLLIVTLRIPPASSRSAAWPSSCRGRNRTPGRTDPAVYPPSPLLRLRLPGGAGGA